MCHNCYHRKGKSKLATECKHKTRPHYSNGKCQHCYLADYYIKKKSSIKTAASKRQRAETARGLAGSAPEGRGRTDESQEELEDLSNTPFKLRGKFERRKRERGEGKE